MTPDYNMMFSFARLPECTARLNWREMGEGGGGIGEQASYTIGHTCALGKQFTYKCYGLFQCMSLEIGICAYYSYKELDPG